MRLIILGNYWYKTVVVQREPIPISLNKTPRGFNKLRTRCIL